MSGNAVLGPFLNNILRRKLHSEIEKHITSSYMHVYACISQLTNYRSVKHKVLFVYQRQVSIQCSVRYEESETLIQLRYGYTPSLKIVIALMANIRNDYCLFDFNCIHIQSSR